MLPYELIVDSLGHYKCVNVYGDGKSQILELQHNYKFTVIPLFTVPPWSSPEAYMEYLELFHDLKNTLKSCDNLPFVTELLCL